MIRISRAKHPRRRKVFSQVAVSQVLCGWEPATGKVTCGSASISTLGPTSEDAQPHNSAGRHRRWRCLTRKWEQADLLPEEGPRAQFDARNDFLAEFSGESSRLS